MVLGGDDTLPAAPGSTHGPDALIGRSLGDFVLRAKLGEGGFGTVYRAEQPLLQREAVVKILHARHRKEEAVIRRFLREARLASRLDHPYAAHIYAFGAEPDGLLWIAMELVRGTPLDRLLAAGGPLQLDRLVTLLDRLCEVVHTAHEQGIIHRDLKPANVMVLSRAGRMLPKLLDLGIAKGLDDHEAPPPIALAESMGSIDVSGRAVLTQGGATLGSPRYMAPEQWLDAAAADARTDLYALGVLAYEALTGKPPFDGTTLMAIAREHARKPVRPLPPGLGPPTLDAFFARALAKAPADRFANALEMAAALRHAAGVADAPEALPQLEETLREQVLAQAPQPLAEAVATLDAARNSHQAWAAAGEVVRVAVQVVAIFALSSRSRVGGGGATDDPRVGEAIRTLRGRELTIAEWSDLVRNLLRPFAARADAHPLPELVMLYFPTGNPAAPAAPFAPLALLDSVQPVTTVDELRARLAPMLQDLGRLLAALEWLSAYPLVVARRDHTERWMGVRRPVRAVMAVQAGLAADRAALVSRDGQPVLQLAPLVQVGAPTPGAPDELFWFHGNGAKGALLVAWPRGFERQDGAVWDWLAAMLLGARAEETPSPASERPPYRGLSPFSADDAGLFFGREAHVETFVNRLKLQPFVGVVGPSGAGKSSFVAAGVLPRLRGYRAITVRPGPSPLAALAARVAQEGGGEAAALRAAFARDPGALGEALRELGEDQPVLLVVDQLEELFTNCRDPEERRLTAELVVRAARSAEDPVRVVVTLRDDFLLRAEALPAFSDAFARGLHILGTPAADELLRIVVEPARQAGFEFDDPELPVRMVDAVKEQPGALSLLSFTAATLWDLRDRHFRQLTSKAYEAIGGVGGALAQHAEATLAAMSPDEQGLVREAFSRLVTAEGTRAVAVRPDLAQVLGGDARAERVLEQLVAARLLVVAEGEAGEERIEIIHEALLAAWPRLVAWRRDDASDARLRDQLRDAVKQWEARGRARSLLLRDDLLVDVQRLRARHAAPLTRAEEALLAASLSDAARGRRVRGAALALVVAMLTAGVVTLWTMNARTAEQRRRAERNERRVNETLLAQYVDQGRQAVLAGDASRALLYLNEAVQGAVEGAAVDVLVEQAARSFEGAGRVIDAKAGRVPAALVTPDGERVVAAYGDGNVRIWDLRDGTLLRTQGGHRDAVGAYTQLQLSADGTLVLDDAADGSARLWRATSGELVATFAQEGGLFAAHLSADGSYVLTIGTDGRARLWSAGGAVLAELGDAAAPSTATARFSADGALIATAGYADGGVRLWNGRTGAYLRALESGSAGLMHVRFSADGRRLVASGKDGLAVVQDLQGGAAPRRLSGHTSVEASEISADGRTVVTRSRTGALQLWDAETGRLVNSMQARSSEGGMVFDRTGTRLVTGGDGGIDVWDAVAGVRLASFEGHVGVVRLAAFVGNGTRLLSAGFDGTIRLWAWDRGARFRAFDARYGSMQSAAFDASGKRLVTAHERGVVILWDVASGAVLATGHAATPGTAFYAGATSPDGRWFAGAATDHAAYVWDAGSGALVRRLVHTGEVNMVSFATDGTLLTASDGGIADLWDVASGVARRTIRVGTTPVLSARFDVAGARVVTASSSGLVQVFDASTGTELRSLRGTMGIVTDAAFSHDGRRIVSSHLDGSVHVWDVATGASIATLRGHSATALSAAFSPNDQLIVSASADQTARIWDASLFKELTVLDGRAAAFGRAGFSPDGCMVATAGDDGVARVWPIACAPRTRAALARLVDCRLGMTLMDGVLAPRTAPPDCGPP